MEELFDISELKFEEGTLDQILHNPEEEVEDKSKDKEKEEEIQEPPFEDPDKEKENENKNNEKEKSKDTPSSESSDDSSTFSVFANLLKEEGVISLDEEDLKSVKTSADLIELMKKQIEISKYEGLSPSQKRYLEAVEAGLPQEEFEKVEKQLKQLEAIDDKTIEENQKARFELIAFDLISKGFSKEKAIEFANRSIKLETDIEDAKDALKSLLQIKSEEYKNTITKTKEENKVSLEELKKKVESQESILKDIKLTPKQRENIYNVLSLKVDSDEKGQPINEFNKWMKDSGIDGQITLAAIYTLTNKFQNLGKILEVSKSKASQELEKKLKETEKNEITEFLKSGSFDINI